VVLTARGVYRGHDGLQELACLLNEELPEAEIKYRTTLIEGDLAFLEWTAKSATAHVEDGADSFVIREGRIVSARWCSRPVSGRPARNPETASSSAGPGS
jgi:hypothetical protein